MSCEQVSHEGIVLSKDCDKIVVSIESKSACGGCAIKSSCNISESSNKKLTVVVSNPDEFSIGEKVIVVMNSSQGQIAAIYAYLIPSAILIVSILLFVTIGINEGLSALLAIALLVPYYFVLYLFRNKFKKQFSFELKHSI